MTVHHSIIHSSHKVETTQMSHQLMNGYVKCDISIKMEYYLAVKRNEVQIYPTPLIDIENIVSERNQA